MTSPESNYRTGPLRTAQRLVRRYPSEWEPCPDCGEFKSKASTLCQACAFSRPSIPQPPDRRKRHLPLTKGYFAVIPAVDYERVLAHSRRWHADIKRRRDGSIVNVYASCHVFVRGRSVKFWLHRLIAGVTDPKIKVDHRDHDGLNCWTQNLRVGDSRHNTWNSRKRINNKSGYIGVHWAERIKKWIASIGLNGKRMHLGVFAFDDLIKAALCYDEAAFAARGEWAYLNFPREVK